MGIDVWQPYLDENKKIQERVFGGFMVQCFDLTDKNGRFMHTNADGSECPCYGFLITHPDMGRLLYITDTQFVKWRFKDINHILISCNYQSKYIDCDEAKRNHVLRGHMELETIKDFVKSNATGSLQNVILCHLSNENANAGEMVAEVQKIVPQANVDYADKEKEWELSEFPF